MPRGPDEASARKGAAARTGKTPAGTATPAGAAAPAREPEDDLGDDLELLDTQLRRARRPALLSMPEQLRSGRIHVSSAAIVALMALVVALGCAFLLRILWAERLAAEERPVAPGVVSTRDAGAGMALPSGGATVMTSGRDGAGTATGPTGGPAAATAGQVVVHVVGQVLRPGLVRLKPGARVADAIDGAGGASGKADLSGLNLARAITDGEQIFVPRPGEVAPSAAPGAVGGPARTDGGTGAAAGSGGGPSGTLVNLNTSGLEELDELPGVGPVLAQRIIDWRTEHGRFTTVDELGEVSGIGDKMLARLRPKVTL